MLISVKTGAANVGIGKKNFTQPNPVLYTLPSTFKLADGYEFPSQGYWDARDAKLTGWPGRIGPTMNVLPPTGLGNNSNPTIAQPAPFRGYKNGVLFNDGYGFGTTTGSFGDAGTNLDIIAEVSFKFTASQTGGAALFGKYDNNIGGWLLWIRNGSGINHLRYSNELNGWSTPATLIPNTWHHALVVSIRSTPNQAGYVILDGYDVATTTNGTVATASCVRPVCIGQEDTNTSGNPSNAEVAQASFWIGTLGFVPTQQQCVAMAKSRYNKLTFGS